VSLVREGTSKSSFDCWILLTNAARRERLEWATSPVFYFDPEWLFLLFSLSLLSPFPETPPLVFLPHRTITLHTRAFRTGVLYFPFSLSWVGSPPPPLSLPISIWVDYFMKYSYPPSKVMLWSPVLFPIPWSFFTLFGWIAPYFPTTSGNYCSHRFAGWIPKLRILFLILVDL